MGKDFASSVKLHIKSLIAASKPDVLLFAKLMGVNPFVRHKLTWLIDVFQIDQLSSVSAHLQLNLVEHAVGENVSTALITKLPNTIYVLFICMQITTLATHHLCLLVDLQTELILQLCTNNVFTVQNAQGMCI